MKTYAYDAVLEPAEEGGWNVSVPALPGCFSEGDSYAEAVSMAADAVMTYVASMLKDGMVPPECSIGETPCPAGCRIAAIAVQTDKTYIVDGEVVSAAQASRDLGVSAGRVTHMLDAGVLEGYRDGRRTYVTRKSIEARLAEQPKAGRPRKQPALAEA